MNNKEKIAEGSSEDYEHQLNLDKTPNSKYVDLLDVDKPIAGQNFTCLSFVSPENILKQKDLFIFEHFLKNWELKKSMEKYTHFLSFISYKYNIKLENLSKDLNNFVEEEKDKLMENLSIEDDYKNFMDENEDNLETQFNEMNNFQTTTRGIKVRGNFPTQHEAELRCKMLRELDPNHDVYVGSVGMWMPFHPEAYKTGRVEYLEDELNQLMHEKKKNEEKAKDEFEKRVKESKMKAIEENKKKAAESGNLLTQTINEDGELISVNNMNTQENNMDKEVSTADIRKELFEGENVVLDKNSDHGLSNLENVTFSLADNKDDKKE
jgi:hypothetical protein